jgi:hypothetical protein
MASGTDRAALENPMMKTFSRVRWSCLLLALLSWGSPGSCPGAESYYGMNEHPQWISPAAQDQMIRYMVKAGVQSVRLDMSWSLVEPSAKGKYDYANRIAKYDNFIAGAKANNIEVLAILVDTPGWANGSKISPATKSSRVVPPDDLSAVGYEGGPGSQNYNDYVGFCMDRWGVHGASPSGPKWIRHWEIWNEPNGYWAWSEASGTTSSWGAGKSDPDKYAWLLKGAYKYIKHKDSTAQVLGVSTSGTNLWTPRGDWVKLLYDRGIKGSFDIFSAHVYSTKWNPAPEPVPAPPELVLGRIGKQLIPVMRQYGEENKRIWITEVGWYTGPASDRNAVTEKLQADFVTRTYAYAKKAMPTVDRLFWYEFTGSSKGTSGENYFGLIRGTAYPNGLPDPWPLKPSYFAYRAIPK